MKCFSCHRELDNDRNSIFCPNCDSFPKSSMGKDEINNIAEDILKQTFKKAIEQLMADFYKTCSSHLYEHENNYRNKIMSEALDLIIGKKWARYRDDYDMAKLRAKLYKEHKEEFDKKITEQVVENEIKRFFNIFLTDEERTGWRYRELEKRVTDWIYKNYDKSKILKKKIPEKFIKENERLREEISTLKNQLLEIKDLSGSGSYEY